jgi:hypothetical protein
LLTANALLDMSGDRTDLVP